MVLRVELWDFEDGHVYADYESFRYTKENGRFPLSLIICLSFLPLGRLISDSSLHLPLFLVAEKKKNCVRHTTTLQPQTKNFFSILNNSFHLVEGGGVLFLCISIFIYCSGGGKQKNVNEKKNKKQKEW